MDKKKHATYKCGMPCDPGGIQTHDLQNRNLTLYSAKLRNLFGFTNAKIYKKEQTAVVISTKKRNSITNTLNKQLLHQSLAINN